MTTRIYKGYAITHLQGTMTFKIYPVFENGTIDFNHLIACASSLKKAKTYITMINNI